MSKLTKAALVLGGYGASFAVACLAVYLNELRLDLLQTQASSGMAAGGDLFLFLFVLGFCSIFPTGLGLYFLRPYEKFWIIFSWAALAFTATGPLAIVLGEIIHGLGLEQQPLGAILGVLVLLRIGGAIVFAGGFLFFTLFAPPKKAKLFLLLAAGVEGLVFFYLIFRILFTHTLF